MATDAERLVLQMSADLRGFEKEMARSRQITERRMAEVERRAMQADQKLSRTFKDMGGRLAQSFQPAQFAAQAAFAAISAYAIKAAADAGEIKNAFDVAFGDGSTRARQFADDLSDKVGRSTTQVQQQMTQLRLVLDGLGFSADKADQLVFALSTRAIDIGSLFNVEDADAFRSIISGITGEAEPMKKFGVVVNQTAVEAELLRLGFKGNASEASEAAKAIARINVMLGGTEKAAGDAARTAGSASNQFKNARGAFYEAAIVLGNQLLPAVTEVTKATTEAIKVFTDLPSGVQVAGLALLGLAAASGPIAAVITALARLIKFAKDAKVALLGLGGAGAAGAAGGAAGGAAAGAGAGLAARAAPGAALGAGLLTGLGSFAPAPPQPSAPVEERLAYARRYQTSSTTLIKRLEEELAAGQLLRRQLAELAGGGEVSLTGNPLEGLGGFGLEGVDVGGGDGGRKKKGRSGPSADQLADRREELDLELAIAAARASGDKAKIEAAEELQELARLTAQYEAAGYSEEDAKFRGKQHLALLNQEKLRTEETERARREAEGELAAREMMRGFMLDMLSVQEQLALTDSDALAVRRQILAVRQKERREALETAAALVTATDNERAAARNALDRLPALERGENRELDASSEGAQDARAIVRDLDPYANAVERAAEAYAEIDRLRQEDVLSEQEAARAKAQVDNDLREQRLSGTRTMLDTLATLQNSSNKKLAALGKAAAIAQATIDGVLAVQKALASAPPPFNYVQAAIVGAVAAANVAQIAGMADGGMVTGVGGPRQDNQLRRLSVGEFVNNAASVRKNRPFLEAANNGADLSKMIPALADGGIVGRVAAASASVSTARQAPGSSITFAPVVDARGADLSAVRRLESALEEQARTFADRVNGVAAKRERFRLRRGRDDD